MYKTMDIYDVNRINFSMYKLILYVNIPLYTQDQPLDTGSTLGEIELTSQGAGTYWYLPPE